MNGFIRLPLAIAMMWGLFGVYPPSFADSPAPRRAFLPVMKLNGCFVPDIALAGSPVTQTVQLGTSTGITLTYRNGECQFIEVPRFTAVVTKNETRHSVLNIDAAPPTMNPGTSFVYAFTLPLTGTGMYVVRIGSSHKYAPLGLGGAIWGAVDSDPITITVH